MAVVRVETFLPCSIERAFDLARDMEVHVRTSAGSERIVSAPRNLLELGDEVTFEARHLGIRQRLTSKIVEFDRPHRFVDEMQRGPFRQLRHEHLFEACDAETKMTDILEFRSISRLIDRLILAGYMRRFLIKRGKALADIAGY